MRILLTGATGYIGKRLLPALVEQGHTVVCVARDRKRFNPPESLRQYVEVFEADLSKPETLQHIPTNIDGAYYLVHSMSTSEDYLEIERQSAENFREAVDKTEARHVIYLSGIVNEDELSEHLQSRLNVERELAKGSYHFTALRAGIIIGSGSASFEIIRDLVEKLPVMIAPRWLLTKCQPIGVSDVISFLTKTLFEPGTYDRDFDIGGPDVLTYREMLLEFARSRQLWRGIWTVPVMTPKLSGYWLYFVTSTSYRLATALVESMKVNVVARDNELAQLLNIEPLSYREALDRAFQRIDANAIVSSWKDAAVSSGLQIHLGDFVRVPEHGCFIDKRNMPVTDRDGALGRVWAIGGQQGWYYGNWLWRIRGFLDRMVGGVGLRRGRTNEATLTAGDALDFWRVLYANPKEGRLLLFAEMKLPGDAWLEFRMENDELVQTATFRPRGIWGRLYWFAVYPFHGFIFGGMLRAIAGRKR